MPSKFPYLFYKGYHRPIIDIDFPKLSGGLFGFNGLVDSGAPWCLFPGFIANLLGHRISEGKPRTMEIGGRKITAYRHKTKVGVDKKNFLWDIYFSHDIDDWAFGILGQEPFFSNFQITFNYPKKEIVLEPCL